MKVSRLDVNFYLLPYDDVVTELELKRWEDFCICFNCRSKAPGLTLLKLLLEQNFHSVNNTIFLLKWAHFVTEAKQNSFRKPLKHFSLPVLFYYLLNCERWSKIIQILGRSMAGATRHLFTMAAIFDNQPPCIEFVSFRIFRCRNTNLNIGDL